MHQPDTWQPTHLPCHQQQHAGDGCMLRQCCCPMAHPGKAVQRQVAGQGRDDGKGGGGSHLAAAGSSPTQQCSGGASLASTGTRVTSAMPAQPPGMLAGTCTSTVFGTVPGHPQGMNRYRSAQTKPILTKPNQNQAMPYPNPSNPPWPGSRRRGCTDGRQCPAHKTACPARTAPC